MSIKRFMGLEFKLMKDDDFECFAGADEGSFIHYGDDEQTVLILSEDEQELVEIVTKDDERFERTWKHLCTI